MKHLLFIIVSLVIITGNVYGQHPSFKKSYEYNKGTISEIHSDGNHLWYLNGSTLETALIQYPDSLEVIDSQSLPFLPDKIEVSKNKLVVTGANTAVFDLADGVIPVVEKIFDMRSGIAGPTENGFYLLCDNSIKFLDLQQGSSIQIKDLEQYFKTNFFLSSDNGLFTYEPGKTLIWWDTKDPLSPKAIDTIKINPITWFPTVALTDSSLWAWNDTILFVYNLNKESGFEVIAEYSLENNNNNFPYSSVMVKDSVVFILEPGIVGHITKCYRILRDGYIVKLDREFWLPDLPPTYLKDNWFLLPAANEIYFSRIESESNEISYKGKFSFGPRYFSNPVIGDKYFLFDTDDSFSQYEKNELNEPLLLKFENNYPSDVIYDDPIGEITNDKYIFGQSGSIYILKLAEQKLKSYFLYGGLSFGTRQLIKMDSLFFHLAGDSFSQINYNWLHIVSQKTDTSAVLLNGIYGKYSDFKIHETSILLADYDMGILSGNLENPEVYPIPITDTLIIKEKIERFEFSENVVVAKLSNMDFVLFYKKPDGSYEESYTISDFKNYYDSYFKIIDKFLLIANTNMGTFLYDLNSPENPVPMGELDIKEYVTGLAKYDNQIVLSHGPYGFTILDYTGYKVSVQNTRREHPFSFSIISAYPNPFNPEATIRFSAPEKGTYSFKIFSLTGAEMRSDNLFVTSPGEYNYNYRAGGEASGMYLFSILSPSGQVITTKLLLLK